MEKANSFKRNLTTRNEIMDLVNDGRWLFKSLGEKLEGKDGGSSVMARAGGCQASPLINPNIIKRKTPGSYTVLWEASGSSCHL